MYSFWSMSQRRLPLPRSMKIACGGESCQLDATPPATYRSAVARYSIDARRVGSRVGLLTLDQAVDQVQIELDRSCHGVDLLLRGTAAAAREGSGLNGDSNLAR